MITLRSVIVVVPESFKSQNCEAWSTLSDAVWKRSGKKLQMILDSIIKREFAEISVHLRPVLNG